MRPRDFLRQMLLVASLRPPPLLLLLLPPPAATEAKGTARRREDRGEVGRGSSTNGSEKEGPFPLPLPLPKGPGPRRPSAAADPELVPGRRGLLLREWLEPKKEGRGMAVVVCADEGVEGENGGFTV